LPSGWRQTWRISAKAIHTVFVTSGGGFGAVGAELTAFSSRRIPALISLPSAASSIAPSQDESKLLLGGRTGGAGILDLDSTHPIILTYWHSGQVLTRLGADQNLYSAGWGDGCVVKWDPRADLPHLLFCIPSGLVDFYVTKSGTIYTANYAGAIVRYEPESERFAVASGLGAIMRIIEDTPSGGVVATTLDGQIEVLGPHLELTWEGTVAGHMGLAFKDATGRLVALTLEGRAVDVAEQHDIYPMSCSGYVNRSWLSEDRQRALMGCKDGRLLTWPPISGAQILQHNGVVADVDGTSDGLYGAASVGGNVSLINPIDRNFIAITSGNKPINIEILSSRQTAIVADETAQLALWSLDQPYHFPLNANRIYDWIHSLKGI
jgi:hypothetical protein